VGVLVLLSLVLITVYFRESSSGTLHRAQGTGATVLRPFEIAAERVARPFRDAYNWTADLFGARAENQRLKSELAQYRQLYVQSESALADNARLRRLLHLQDAPTYPHDFTQVNARIIGHAPSDFDQQVMISAGSVDGLREHDPVITADGLVGELTLVTPHEAQVTLLTDESSHASAVDLITGARGIVSHGQGATQSLILDRVTKDQKVRRDDLIVTAGSQAGRLPSIYPHGLTIGLVTSVGESDTALYKQIQVAPAVDFSSLDSVAVLVSKKPRPELR
jgi:rod shape-determining protein MreC